MTPDYYKGLEDRDVVDCIQHWANSEQKAREHRQRAEQELQRRMEAQGATSLPHPTLDVRLVQATPTYDPSKLRRLYEVLPKEVVDPVVATEHDEVVRVPEKWNAVKFKTLAKYGAEVAGIILEARLPSGPPRLVIKERKP